MARFSIPKADARPTDDRWSAVYIDCDPISGPLLPRAVAETMANAWNAAAAICRPDRGEPEITLHRTMVLAGHEAEVTLVVSFNVFGSDVTMNDVRVYDDTDYTSIPLMLPAPIRAGLLDDDEIYDKVRQAVAAMRAPAMTGE